MLHNDPRLNSTFVSRKSELRFETFKQISSLSDIGEQRTEYYFEVI